MIVLIFRIVGINSPLVLEWTKTRGELIREGELIQGYQLILLYKNVLCLFFKIIYFMKTLTKLVDSNMEFHGFFELRRDTTGAWSVFRFFNSS